MKLTEILQEDSKIYGVDPTRASLLDLRDLLKELRQEFRGETDPAELEALKHDIHRVRQAIERYEIGQSIKSNLGRRRESPHDRGRRERQQHQFSGSIGGDSSNYRKPYF